VSEGGTKGVVQSSLHRSNHRFYSHFGADSKSEREERQSGGMEWRRMALVASL